MFFLPLFPHSRYHAHLELPEGEKLLPILTREFYTVWAWLLVHPFSIPALSIKVQGNIFLACRKHQYWLSVEWILWLLGSGGWWKWEDGIRKKKGTKWKALHEVSLCRCIIGSLPWFQPWPWGGWVCAVGLVLSKCTPDDDVRGPKVTRTLTMQPNIYYSRKQMIKDLISSVWTPHCAAALETKFPTGWYPEGLG